MTSFTSLMHIYLVFLLCRLPLTLYIIIVYLFIINIYYFLFFKEKNICGICDFKQMNSLLCSISIPFIWGTYSHMYVYN